MPHQTLRPTPTALLNPRCDPSFKALFTHDTPQSNIALADFISAMLGRTVTHIELQPNEPPIDTLEEMQMSFDVAVTFDSGEKAAIEMQGRDREYDWGARAEIQCARLLNVAAKKGERWNAAKVYQMSVLNFRLDSNDKQPFSWYTMKDKDGRALSELLNVLFFELPKIRALYGTPPDKLTKLQKWGLFLSFADKPEAQEYIASLLQGEEGLMGARTALSEVSEDERNWWVQNSYDIARRDRADELWHVEERGRAEGSRAAKLEAARNALSMGLTIAQTAQLTGLSPEEITRLQ